MSRSTALRRDFSHSEKVQYVFEGMTEGRGDSVTEDAFVSMFHTLRISIGSEMLKEIYDNAASSRARGMTHGEFQVFSEQYPTILDSLCFRLRDSEEDARQQLQLARLRERIDGLKDAEASLLEQHRRALDGLDDRRATLDDAESAVASAAATCTLFLLVLHLHHCLQALLLFSQLSLQAAPPGKMRRRLRSLRRVVLGPPTVVLLKGHVRVPEHPGGFLLQRGLVGSQGTRH
eukprot:Rhum_TRINITY_DN10323_c0_g2::Rhum_TRINITY_DN10323_c0_g2_i2::g.38001::m.38001